MKHLYALLGLSSILLLVLGSAITFAGSKADYFALKLANSPETWSIEVKDSAYAKDGEEAKNLLVQYIEAAGSSTASIVEKASSVLLVTIGFSGIGWIRERQLEKKLKRAKRGD